MIVTRGLGVGSGSGSLPVFGLGGWSDILIEKIKKRGRGLRRRDARFFKLVRENLVQPVESEKKLTIRQEFSKSKPKPDIIPAIKSVVEKTLSNDGVFSEKRFLDEFKGFRGYIDGWDLAQIRVTLLGMIEMQDEDRASAMFAEIIRRVAEERDEEEVLHVLSLLI